MQFSETYIKGLYVIEPKHFRDERGSFFRTFCKSEYESIGLEKEFVQINQSINHKKYTFRGFHYQIAPHEDCKLIKCVRGKVIDIIIDVRKSSSTFLKHFSIELTAANNKMVYVPEGMAHGFLTLEDDSQLLYNHTAFYTPGFEGELNIKDPRIDVKLPYPIKIISKKDLKIPFLASDFEGI